MEFKTILCWPGLSFSDDLERFLIVGSTVEKYQG